MTEETMLLIGVIAPFFVLAILIVTMYYLGDEDYYTGLRVQKALATGAKQYSIFGRNEGGGQLFHRWVDAILEANNEDLHQLFSETPEILCIPEKFD